MYLVIIYGGLQGGAKTPLTELRVKGERRGEQCSPEELYGSARFCWRAMPVPTACQIQIKVKQTSPHFLAEASALLAAVRRLRARRQGIPLLPA